jgi:alpha-amylase/alpha-mannosidase (GH57 family)
MDTSSTGWREKKYQEIFDEELRALERRREVDKNCTVEDIEGVLKNLYIAEGSDWVARGDLQDIIATARIAAHEHFITNWCRPADGISQN